MEVTKEVLELLVDAATGYFGVSAYGATKRQHHELAEELKRKRDAILKLAKDLAPYVKEAK